MNRWETMRTALNWRTICGSIVRRCIWCGIKIRGILLLFFFLSQVLWKMYKFFVRNWIIWIKKIYREKYGK
jgi:hypothetical protein